MLEDLLHGRHAYPSWQDIAALARSEYTRLGLDYRQQLHSLFARTLMGHLHYINRAFPTGPITQHSCFPKFWALKTYLEAQRQRPDFHCIVFAETRTGVYHLAAMLRRLPSLNWLALDVFCGDGGSAAGNDSGLGMTKGQRDRTLAWFREKGASRLLISTSAAEEGVDIQACQSVVCYAVPSSGVKWLQSKGRARARDAEYLILLQEGSQDEKAFARSKQQMENILKLLRSKGHEQQLARLLADRD